MADAGEPVRWGILGTGWITDAFLTGARAAASSASVVAVGSRTPERATGFADAQGISRAHGSYDALLADDAVEAVYIALPNSLHHSWTMRALGAGKHVLCEKPYSPRPVDVDAAFDSAEARGLVLSEAFMWRHHPQVEALRALLPELGELQVIRSTFGFVLQNPDDIRLRPDLEEGSLLDVGTYCVSGARLLAGEEPIEAFGTATIGPTGVDVRFTGVLRFPSGVVAEFTSSFTADHRGLEAIGSTGSAIATDPWHGRPAVLVRDGIETRLPDADPYRLEIEDVSSAIRTGRAVLVGRAASVGQARVLEALRRSAATGQVVRLG